MSINGPGAALLTVRRNAGGTYRIFHVTTASFLNFSGMTISDGSGLARQTRVPADSMVKMFRVAAGQKHPELRGVITGLRPS